MVGLISDDDAAGTAFREDQLIRHPHDLGAVPARPSEAPTGISSPTRHDATSRGPRERAPLETQRPGYILVPLAFRD